MNASTPSGLIILVLFLIQLPDNKSVVFINAVLLVNLHPPGKILKTKKYIKNTFGLFSSSAQMKLFIITEFCSIY